MEYESEDREGTGPTIIEVGGPDPPIFTAVSVLYYVPDKVGPKQSAVK